MAQQSQLNPLHDIRSLTWSQLPALRYTEGYSTVNESISSFALTKDQLIPWKNFEASVRAITNTCLGWEVQLIPTQTEKEVIRIGNEHGLMGRFGQNVSHVMSEIYESCHLPIFFGDYQAGKTHIDAQNYRKIPDLVLLDDQHMIRAIGEGKTFWTKNLMGKDPIIRAGWLGEFILSFSVEISSLKIAGQLARYMDDLGLRFGFYTTYNAPIFLKRASDLTFEESPPILHCTTSTEKGSVSVRECFLYLAKLASLDSYKYLKTIGNHLTDNSLVEPERRSMRLLEKNIENMSIAESSKKK
ncbi:MAG: hypothetical protein M1839_008585 [Geoglossum umbratile]|nr:MAG: hypothetical protein M1839_008585 [Geoglossum umbratile]